MTLRCVYTLTRFSSVEESRNNATGTLQQALEHVYEKNSFMVALRSGRVFCSGYLTFCFPSVGSNLSGSYPIRHFPFLPLLVSLVMCYSLVLFEH